MLVEKIILQALSCVNCPIDRRFFFISGTIKIFLDERKNEVFTAFTNKASNAIWHQRLGHTHSNFLKILQEKHLINVIDWKKQETICLYC